MLLNQPSFLIAVSLACAALAMTAIILWVHARTYKFLLLLGTGLATCAPAIIILAAFLDRYDSGLHLAASILLIQGIILAEASARTFRTGVVDLPRSAILWVVCVTPIAGAFIAGLTGVGTMFLNLACGLVCLSGGLEFWRARSESPLTIKAISACYALLGISFLLCIVPLAVDGQYILDGRQQNWAEDINLAVGIVAVATIGALVLVLAQGRTTQMHRDAAQHDSLTGLLNRRALFERAGELALNRDAAVIMFDLDNFKRVNDRFGHGIGDEVLQRFARIVRENIRAGDIAARIGGEEFCVLVAHLPLEAVYEIAERIRSTLEASAPLADDHGPPTVSAGVAVNGGTASTLEELIRRADEALYVAKASGKNRVRGPKPQLVTDTPAAKIA